MGALVALGVVVAVALVAGVIVARRAGGDAAPRLSVATALVTEGSEVAAAYLAIRNDGGRDDLLAVQADGIGTATVHGSEAQGGTVVMTELASLAVAGHHTTVLAPGGAHVMLEGIATPLEAGQELWLRLTFRRSGTMDVRASVVSYTQLAEWVERASP